MAEWKFLKVYTSISIYDHAFTLIIAVPVISNGNFLPNIITYKLQYDKMTYYVGRIMNKVTNILWPSDWRVIHKTFSNMNTNIEVNSFP